MYAPINGLQMYYEVHGEGSSETGIPLVLMHGALSATETSFGPLVGELAKSRTVIAVEQQAHGRTADIDRPLRLEQMADDTAALLAHLDIEWADFFGYSTGSAIAMRIALSHRPLVRKMVLASVGHTLDAIHPGVMDGMQYVTAEAMTGSPFEQEYLRLAPNPGDWPTLIEKIKDLNAAGNIRDLTPEELSELDQPILIVIGDSDIIRPEGAVEFFRLLGGGVIGDMVGLPKSQLAILPGTTHVTVPHQVDLLTTIIPRFLDKESA